MAKMQALPRIDELDGLRGFLAVWVAVAHVLCWCGYAEPGWPQPFVLWWPDFIFSQPAVETFMILSGFAISFLLHARRATYLEFMRGRFFRIYPVYLVCLLFGCATIYLIPFILGHAGWRDNIYFRWLAAVSVSEREHTASHLLNHLTLLNGLVPRKVLLDSAGTLLPPAWSISLEWQYYLVAPLLAVFVCSGSRLLLLAGVAYVGRLIGGHWLNPQLAFLPAQLPFFLIGIGSYHLYARFASAAPWRSDRFAVPAAVGLSAAVLLSWHATALIIWALAFGCVFVEGRGVFAGALQSLRRLLLHPWLQHLGKISYPIYLLHWPVVVVFLFLILHWKPAATSAEAAVWMLGLSIPTILLLAEGLHRLVEIPMMRAGKRTRREMTGGSAEKTVSYEPAHDRH